MSAPRTSTKVKVQSVTPFLWFEKGCARAAEFYATLIQGSRIVSKNAMGCEFELAGQRVMALDGGPVFELSPAFSFFVSVRTQAQVDALWSRLTANGGKESRCGWLTDKFGVSWQIIPHRLTDLLADKDPDVAQAAFGAMMKMGKIEIADLDAAVAAVKQKTRKKVVA
jgi:predicted 3-demethylubiquinone-9 3-methyltransferase (glyoxalase superfamily)